MRLLTILCATASLTAAEWAGTWTNGQLRLDLAGQPTALTGEVVLDGERFPVTAAEEGLRLAGTFSAAGTAYRFQAELVDGVMVLTSDGERYELRRQRANPLVKGTGAGAAATAVDPLVGSWRGDDGELVDLRADGTALVGGGQARWRSVGGVLTIGTSEGESVIPYRITGDVLVATVDGESATYRRVGAAAAPAPVPAADGPLSAESLTGVWLGPEGGYVLGAGGRGQAKGKEFTWAIEGTMLAFTQDGQFLKVPARIAAGRLVLGSGPSVELDRAEGAAGWWSGSDTAVDATMAMSITHRIALYPDGTVGYAKGELGAGRAQGWYSYRRDQGARQTVGTWRQSGAQVQFNLGSGTYAAVFDAGRQIMRVRGMGQINEGSDLDFTRE